MSKLDFAHFTSKFFSMHLPGHLNVSKNTIRSYRDTFSQLLTFFETKRIKPERLTFSHFSRSVIEDFLLWLESERGCGISTVNQRLTVLRSFFRYVQIECPEHLELCKSIIDITAKKGKKSVIKYLNKAEIQLLLAQPDTSTPAGRRDLAILSVLYDSAARVQELCELDAGDIRDVSPAILTLSGKCRKSRYVPLTVKSNDILQGYMAEFGINGHQNRFEVLFPNRQGNRFTRAGIAYILRKYVSQANREVPGALPEKLTPHCLRHSKAMHMLEAGIGLVYIRDFLGHEDIATTQNYAKANPEVKRIALQNAYADNHTPPSPSWNDDPGLKSFLKTLGR
jgi:site-specific recombinase XerD